MSGLPVERVGVVAMQVHQRFGVLQAGWRHRLISTDLEELLGMCDRIAVIANGALDGTVENADDARTKVGRLIIGLAA